ncbi:hypothetical protein B0H13DRAFT_1914112 [Mycena leptocephala]|nr:hypothetical protein B0H13DRAFT_1914112 [Mycena leptocephala]
MASQPKHPSRKLTDLIYRSTAKFASWNPPPELEESSAVGDFGVIDKDSGEFIKEGCIWDIITYAVEDRPIQASSPEEMLEVVLSGVSKQSLEKSPLGGSEGIEKAVVNQYWDFGSKLAAVIILYQPQSFYLYPKSVIENFKKLPQLKNKAIVTEVVKCQAYAFCFSEESVVAGKLALKLVPSEHADADGKPNYKWLTDMSAGLECYATTAASPFCALYSLKEIETNRFMPFR